jgi:hypothetical protein
VIGSDSKVIWKSIEGFDKYEVSNTGNIRNIESGKILKNSLSPSKGYFRVNLMRDGKRHTFEVHLLVAGAFLGPTPQGRYIDHRDDTKTNNYDSNLQFLTNRQNTTKPLAKKHQFLGTDLVEGTQSRWRARCLVDGKRKTIISSGSRRVAANAYSLCVDFLRMCQIPSDQVIGIVRGLYHYP